MIQKTPDRPIGVEIRDPDTGHSFIATEGQYDHDADFDTTEFTPEQRQVWEKVCRYICPMMDNEPRNYPKKIEDMDRYTGDNLESFRPGIAPCQSYMLGNFGYVQLSLDRLVGRISIAGTCVCCWIYLDNARSGEFETRTVILPD